MTIEGNPTRQANPRQSSPPSRLRAELGALAAVLTLSGALLEILGNGLSLKASWTEQYTARLQLQAVLVLAGMAPRGPEPPEPPILILGGGEYLLRLPARRSAPARHELEGRYARDEGSPGEARPLRGLTSCPHVAPLKLQMHADPATLARELAPCAAKVLAQ